MTVLLILTTLGVVVFGYCIMGRMDKFLRNMDFEDDDREEKNSNVLLFASKPDFSSFETSLTDKKISYISTYEPDIPDNMQIMTVLAVSNNDLDNLSLCCKARHLFPNAFLIAKCNDMLYHGIFKETGIHRIVTHNLTANVIISTLMDSSILH